MCNPAFRKLFLLVRRVERGVRQRIRDRGSMGYVSTTCEPSAAVVIIAARVTPALLVAGGALMVAESRLGGEQIHRRSDKHSPGWTR
jgi:hypothetical protein